MLGSDDRKSIMTGVGLACSLGWLWFPWLSAVWLPGVVWGSAGSGGGAAFLLILVAVFFAGGFLSGRLAIPREDDSRRLSFLRFHCRHFCHGSSYILLVAVLLLRLYGPLVLPAIWPYLAVPMAALAYVFCGLYWGARLLALPQTAAPSAFLCSVIAAGLMGLLLSFFPLASQVSLWPQGLLIVWALAEVLAREEKAQGKTRGRPRKREPESAPPPIEIAIGAWRAIPETTVLGFSLALAIAAFSCAGGSTWLRGGSLQPLAPAWATWVFFAVGTFVPALVIRRPYDPLRRGFLASIAIVLSTLLAICLPAAYIMNCPVAFAALAEGTISGFALALFADRELKNGTAVRGAGVILCASVVSLNGGWMLGELANGMLAMTLAFIFAIAGGLPLMSRPIVSWREKMKRTTGQASANAANVNDSESDAGASGLPAPISFTREESQIINLLASEGLSNQAIADALFISRATVRYHLRKIYAKTDTTNREELLAFIAIHFGIEFTDCANNRVNVVEPVVH